MKLIDNVKDRGFGGSGTLKAGGLAKGRVAAMVLAGVMVVTLSGCKTSQTLTELLFDQNSDHVDESTGSRFLRNVLDGLDMTEDLAELLPKDISLQRDRVEETPVLGEDVVNGAAPESEYDAASTSTSESSKAGDDSVLASDTQTGKSRGNSSKKGKKAEEGTGEGTQGSAGGSDASESEGDGTVYHGDGGTGDVYGQDGTYAELPEGVQTVVAFGECANMVVSFAGEHALSGADSGFLSNSFIKRAYKDKDIANVKTVKVSKKGVVDVATVVKLQPDAVLLSGGDCSFTVAGLKELKEARIDVVYLPAPVSASNITLMAESIGSMFGTDTLSGDNAEAAASRYVAWHDDVVASVVRENGGLAGDRNYDTGKDNDGPVGNYTLYVDQWDDATYYATPDGALSWTDENGVAISKVGYKWSPMSYYLSAGGTQNVSATFKSSFYDTTALYYVWQFNLGRIPTVYAKNWSGVSVATSPLSNSGTGDLLTKAADGTTLGASNFSYVIAGSQAVANKMAASVEAANKTGTGLYATYGSVRGTDGSGIGFLSRTGQYCSASISGSFDIVTNPCGLYSSWVDGSAESVLEAVWISDLNHGTSRLSTYLMEYYELFYGVNLSSSQVKTIVAGASE